MEHLGVQKYLRYYKLLSINYSNVSASSSSDLLWRRLYGDRHEIRPRIYDFIEQESAYSFLNCPDPSHFNEFFFHPPTLSYFQIKTLE